MIDFTTTKGVHGTLCTPRGCACTPRGCAHHPVHSLSPLKNNSLSRTCAGVHSFWRGAAQDIRQEVTPWFTDPEAHTTNPQG